LIVADIARSVSFYGDAANYSQGYYRAIAGGNLPREGSKEPTHGLPGDGYNWKIKDKLKGNIMAKDKSSESVYRVTEVIGTSAQSWEDAAKTAVQTAAGTLRDLRVAEVVKMDVKIEDGKVVEYRTRLQLSFKYES
jgi:flavin-binding protein dodecin